MNKEPTPLFRSNCSIPKVYIPPSLQILRVAPHLSVTRNPRKELFWVVAILPQSRPLYLQSARLRMDSGFLAIMIQLPDCAPIGLESCPLRLHLDCDSRPQAGALTQDPCPGIPCNPIDTSQSSRNPSIRKGWSC